MKSDQIKHSLAVGPKSLQSRVYDKETGELISFVKMPLEEADVQRIGTSDSDKGEYAIHQVRIFQERLAQAIEQMPFGDTAASFAAFVREFK